MPHPNTDLTDIDATTRELRRLMPTYEHQMALLMRDGYPADVMAGATGGGISDPTGTAATARANRDWAMFCAAVHQAREALRDALADVHRTLRDFDGWKRHRCTGGMGMDGADEWGDPTCEQVIGQQSETGLCDRCRHARNRWERERRRVDV